MPPRKPTLSANQIRAAQHLLFVEGEHYETVAGKFNVSERTLRYYCGTKRQNKIKIQKPALRALTPMEEHQAVHWYNSRVTKKEIARRLNVSPATITKCVGYSGNKPPTSLTKSQIKLGRHLLFKSRFSYDVVASLLDVSEPNLRTHCGTRTDNQIDKRAHKTGTFKLHVCHTTKTAYICLPRPMLDAFEETGLTPALSFSSRRPTNSAQ